MNKPSRFFSWLSGVLSNSSKTRTTKETKKKKKENKWEDGKSKGKEFLPLIAVSNFFFSIFVFFAAIASKKVVAELYVQSTSIFSTLLSVDPFFPADSPTYMWYVYHIITFPLVFVYFSYFASAPPFRKSKICQK